jgi:hypothetical protein
LRRIAAAASILAISAASAQQLPSFNIEKHCENAGSGREYCVERTQAIYSELQQQWDSIPAAIRAKCLHSLKTSPRKDSYYWLQGCLRYETAPPPPAYGIAPPPPGYYGYYGYDRY